MPYDTLGCVLFICSIELSR